MKTRLWGVLAVLTLTATVGCGQGVTTATILPPDGSTGSTPAPIADKGSDEIIAPKSETPPPVVSPDPVSPDPSTPPKTPDSPSGDATGSETPPALPTPVKAPDPIFIPMIPISPKPVAGLTDVRQVTVENGSGSGGAEHTFLCPAGSVVTGFRFGSEAYDVTPESSFGEGSIETSTAVIGGLRIVCSHLDQDHVNGDLNSLASYLVENPDTSELSAVTHAGQEYDLDSAVICPNADGVATGVIGRAGDRLDSFGLTCGLYLHNDTFTGVFPAAKETPTGEEAAYGGMPGNGGAAFEASCDANEAVVGVTIASGDQVDGIRGLTCAKVTLVDAK